MRLTKAPLLAAVLSFSAGLMAVPAVKADPAFADWVRDHQEWMTAHRDRYNFFMQHPDQADRCRDEWMGWNHGQHNGWDHGMKTGWQPGPMPYGWQAPGGTPPRFNEWTRQHPEWVSHNPERYEYFQHHPEQADRYRHEWWTSDRDRDRWNVPAHHEQWQAAAKNCVVKPPALPSNNMTRMIAAAEHHGPAPRITPAAAHFELPHMPAAAHIPAAPHIAPAAAHFAIPHMPATHLPLAEALRRR